MLNFFWLYQTWPVNLKIQEQVLRRPKLEVATKRLLHQQVKIPEKFSCHVARENVSLELFLVVGIFPKSLHVICCGRWFLSEVQKNYLVSREPTAYLFVYDLFLAQWIMSILTKGCKPHNSESHNSLKLRVTNIHSLLSSLWWLNWFWKFLLTVYVPFIRKDSITHMHDLAVYAKEGLLFSPDLSLDSYLCFRLALLRSVS